MPSGRVLCFLLIAAQALCARTLISVHEQHEESVHLNELHSNLRAATRELLSSRDIQQQVSDEIARLAGMETVRLGQSPSARKRKDERNSRSKIAQVPLERLVGCETDHSHSHPCTKALKATVVTALLPSGANHTNASPVSKMHDTEARKIGKKLDEEHHDERVWKNSRRIDRQKRHAERQDKKLARAAEMREQEALLRSKQQEHLKWIHRREQLATALQQMQGAQGSLVMRGKSTVNMKELKELKRRSVLLVIDLHHKRQALRHAKQQSHAVAQQLAMLNGRIDHERRVKRKALRHERKTSKTYIKATRDYKRLRDWERLQRPDAFQKKERRKLKSQTKRIVQHMGNKFHAIALGTIQSKVNDLRARIIKQKGIVTSLKWVPNAATELRTAQGTLDLLKREAAREQVLLSVTRRTVRQDEMNQDKAIQKRIKQLQSVTADDTPGWLGDIDKEEQKSTDFQIELVARSNRAEGEISQARIDSIQSSAQEMITAIKQAKEKEQEEIEEDAQKDAPRSLKTSYTP